VRDSVVVLIISACAFIPLCGILIAEVSKPHYLVATDYFDVFLELDGQGYSIDCQKLIETTAIGDPDYRLVDYLRDTKAEFSQCSDEIDMYLKNLAK